MGSFEQIHILDLHGSTKKKEQAPDGSKDENVFDIQQGVAISLFIKNAGLTRGVFHADLWGRRIHKYKAAAGMAFKDTGWQRLAPVTPTYLFIPQDKSEWQAYSGFRSINEIMPISGVGIVTARDHLSIHFDKASLKKTIREFVKSWGRRGARSVQSQG